MKTQLFPMVNHPRCLRTRLAEGEVAAIDRCTCGAFQVHLGAFTVRLDGPALRSLMETLDRAVTASARPELGLVESNGWLRLDRANDERSGKS